MRYVLLLIGVLVVAGVIWALVAPEDMPWSPGPKGPGDAGTHVPPEEAARLPGGTPPPEEPEVDLPRFRERVRTLILARFRETFPVLLSQQWQDAPAERIHIRTDMWTPPPPPGANVPSYDPEAILPAPPTPETFRRDPPHVLVLYDLDPAVLDDAVWEAAADLVRSGEMGLLVFPGVETGKALLAHPVLGPLLPIAEADDPMAAGLPGVFRKEGAEGVEHRPFRLTEAGARHPLTRLVPWPTWSQRIWDRMREVKHPWGTPFCYPVVEVRPGSSVLLEVDSPRGRRIPALVASDPEERRVLWMGCRELGPRLAYGQSETVTMWRALLLSWAAWLSRQ